MNKTNKNKTNADTLITNMINKYGTQNILQALLNHYNQVILTALLFNEDDDYLYNLKRDLERTLENYMARYE